MKIYGHTVVVTACHSGLRDFISVVNLANIGGCTCHNEGELEAGLAHKKQRTFYTSCLLSMIK